MKKLMFAALFTLLTACGNNKPTQQKITVIRYTCPMHPQILTDKPGTCPKCGMELVEKDEAK